MMRRALPRVLAYLAFLLMVLGPTNIRVSRYPMALAVPPRHPRQDRALLSNQQDPTNRPCRANNDCDEDIECIHVRDGNSICDPYVETVSSVNTTVQRKTQELCSSEESMFTLELKFDYWAPEDNSWTLVHDGSGTTILSGANYDRNEEVTVTACLTKGESYTYTFTDDWGDSICCSHGQGHFKGYLDSAEIFSGGEGFGSEAVEVFVVPDSWPSPTPAPTTPNPTSAPTMNPTPKPSNIPTTLSITLPVSKGGCSAPSLAELILELKLDGYGHLDNSWTLVNDDTGDVVESVNSYTANAEDSQTMCLPNGEFTFNLVDSYGDGVCCSYGKGSFKLTLDGVEILSGGPKATFTENGNKLATITFTVDKASNPSPTPVSTAKPATSPTIPPQASPTPISTGAPTKKQTSSPTLKPSNDPTKMPTLSPTSVQGIPPNSDKCEAGTSEFVLELKLDSYGHLDNSWTLTNDFTGDVMDSGGSYSANAEDKRSICLPNGDFTFTLIDSYGDSICCSYGAGFYKGTLNGIEIFFGGESFGSKAVETFTIQNDVGPSPTKKPAPSPTLEPTSPPTSPPLPNPLPVPIPTNVPTPFPTQAPIPLPTPTPPITKSFSSILQNWNFESASLDPWFANGSGESIDRLYDADRGSNVGAAIDRSSSETWGGLGQDTTDLFDAGTIYDVSISAKLLNVPSGTTERFLFTIEIKYSDADTEYQALIYTENGLTTEWKTFESTFGPFAPSGTISELRLFAEGPTNGYDFAIDDVIVLPQAESPTGTPVPPAQAPSGPSGDYVGADDNTEVIDIPVPPQADFTSNTDRSNCPHDRISLIDWKSQFGTSLSEGQDVTLPDESTILISESIPTKLGYITIPPSSTLIIGEDPSSGISLDAEGIDVQGSLVAGSDTCRLQSPVTITLHGNRPSSAQAEVYKGISVTGTISLHGKRYYRTWTKLAKRVKAGETSLYLQDEVNWEPGQEIVLVTSAVRDSRDWHENEVHVISSVSTSNTPSAEVKSVIQLTAPAQYDHIARQEYQVEVGLLSRMITVQGAAGDSPPTDTTPASCQLVNDYGGSRFAFGYGQVDCPDTFLTGYGGHIMIHDGGIGYVEGVELYRMGQTNFLGRYPIHFHLLGEGCADCYFRDSSVHESYYRCISIHGTNGISASENVAYDVTGFCYYLEDGVEERNTLSFNLAAHVHFIGNPALGGGQRIAVVEESPDLLLPADVAASGFYITNLHNFIIGNVAVGGWAGFAFPILDKPVGLHKDDEFSPKTKVSLIIDGNTAHSTAHFWDSAAAFYFGGSLYFNSNDRLEYNAGRDNDESQRRDPCEEDVETGECISTENHLTNSKVFLVGNVGVGSWSGKMDVEKYEAHDVGLAVEALVSGFWIDQMTVVCRTGELLKLPVQRANEIRGNGFVWYDTGQDHIITDSTFRNCGFRSDEFNQYDSSDTRGCDSNSLTGCDPSSSTFGFLTHSDEFNPEIMQATSGLVFDNIGRKFRFSRTDIDTVSGRTQNWFDADGSTSGFNEPTLIGSGLSSAGLWWTVDDEVYSDTQGPVTFIKQNDGPARGFAHIRLEWDVALHATVGVTDCVNGRPAGEGPFCLSHGYIRYLGEKFSVDDGLPVTAQPEIVGLAGGYGWLLTLNEGAPKSLKIMEVEVLPDTPLIFSVQYPAGTSVSVVAKAVDWCYPSCDKPCEEIFTQVSTVEEVRTSIGNVYHLDSSTWLLTIRIIMFPELFTGLPDWKLFDFQDIGDNGEGYALKRFSRKGVLLPRSSHSSSYILIEADCVVGGSNNAYCQQQPDSSVDLDGDICSSGFEQVSYDRCCEVSNPSNCEYPPSYEAAPTAPPNQTPAPTFANPEVIVNGGFEEGVSCPWLGRGGVNLDLETTIVSGGSSAARISGRLAGWHGLEQNVFGRLKLDTMYDLQGQLYILNGKSDNTIQVQLGVHYDTSTESCSTETSYHNIWWGDDLTGETWISLSNSYELSSSSLESGCDLVGIELFIQSWPDGTFDFVVDDLSLYDSSA